MSKKWEVILVGAVVVALGFLRFYNLGHSEYIPDETTVLYPLKESRGFSREFFLNQRKGPLQFVISYIPFIFEKNIFDEGVFRLPFAIASTLSLVFFYLFIRNISGRKLVALLSTFLIGVCGFTVGLGRIVQYQGLNLLFSSAALYFYSLILIGSTKRRLVNSLLGTFFCCLSLLSHWDAVFYFPIMFWIFGRLLIDKDVPRDFKIKIIITNIFLSMLLLLPFLLPYIKSISASNLEYFETRVGAGGENNTFIEKLTGYKSKVDLYNPFYYLWLILGSAALAFLNFRRTKAVFSWFIINFLIFLLFIKHEGTHLYNLFIPLSILSGFGLTLLIDKFNRVWKIIIATLTFVPLLFFFYQSFLVFACVQKEYPFERETILGRETKRYTHKQLPNNVIGFPIRRGWVEINEYLKELGYPRYITNENQSISNFYVEGMYGEGEGVYYIIGIKKPLSFTLDYSFPQVKGKHTVKEIDVSGSTTAKIYIVDGQR
ncbi:ArnT family glycosyltransferase [Patescibacteria group bacterium]